MHAHTHTWTYTYLQVVDESNEWQEESGDFADDPEGLPESFDIYVPFRSKLAKIHRKAYNNIFLLSKDIYLLSHDLE